MIRHFSIRLLLFVGIGIAAAPLSASEELREKLGQMAGDILKAVNNQPVTVGQFSPTALVDSNSGPGIEALLTEELNAHSPGCVRAESAYEIKGDYAFVKDRHSPDLKMLKINARLIEKEFGEELQNARIHVEVRRNHSIAQLLQVTTSLPGDHLSKSAELEHIEKSVHEPQVYIHPEHPSQVSSSPQSPYAIELYVKPLHDKGDARPRVARLDKGRAWVDIRPNELYEIKLHNRSKLKTAVTLTVDGINVFHFSKDRKPDGRPAYSHYVLEPHSSTVIVGWHHRVAGDTNFLSFLVTAYGQGAASQAGLPSRGEVGVIHASFAHCFDKVEGTPKSADAETGFGPPRKVHQEPQAVYIDPPHDFVSIRYAR